jgi:hypothetical protein
MSRIFRHFLLLSAFGLVIPFAPPAEAGKTKAADKTKAAARPAAASLPPTSLISSRAQRVLSTLKSRPLRPIDGAVGESALVVDEPTRASWLKAVYGKGLIEASWPVQMLADRRIMAEVLQRELGVRARDFYPKTMGLREFLFKHALIDPQGRINASGETIEAALFREFPAGYIVRPAVGVAPGETGRGLFPETDQFIVEILKPKNPYYSPAHRQPVRSSILGTVASGEAIVLQESVLLTADIKKPLKTRFFHEVRVHTYEARVVPGAVPSRWVQTNLLSDQQIRDAEKFVAGFLGALPLSIVHRQAWGVDVAVMDNGEMRIIDVVTNRGRAISWSGYLDQPKVIGAYSRHFETALGVRFEGWSGTLIRHNLANYMTYWQKRIDKSKPGLGRLKAYLPPLP